MPWKKPEFRRLPHRAQLAPGIRPGGLDRILGEVLVPHDEDADATHVVVMGVDDAREGELIAIGC